MPNDQQGEIGWPIIGAVVMKLLPAVIAAVFHGQIAVK